MAACCRKIVVQSVGVGGDLPLRDYQRVASPSGDDGGPAAAIHGSSRSSQPNYCIDAAIGNRFFIDPPQDGCRPGWPECQRVVARLNGSWIQGLREATTARGPEQETRILYVAGAVDVD